MDLALKHVYSTIPKDAEDEVSNESNVKALEEDLKRNQGNKSHQN